MEYLRGDNIIFNKRKMKSRFIAQIYAHGVNYVPEVFLGDTKPYGRLIREYEIQISKDRFLEVHFAIRNGIKTSIEFKKNLIVNTNKVLDEFQNMMDEFQNSLKDGTFNVEKMFCYIQSHIKALSLAEYNGCLPIEWYENTISTLFGNKTLYSHFGCTDFLSHRQQFRNIKLKLTREYIQEGKISEESLKNYWVNYHHLDTKIDHCTIFNTNEVDIFYESIKELAMEYTVEKINKEILFDKESFKKAKDQYNGLLEYTKTVMEKKNYSKDEIENYILALKIISLATTEEERRHMVQDKFFRLITYVFYVYKLSPIFTSIEMLLDTINTIPYGIVRNNEIIERFA